MSRASLASLLTVLLLVGALLGGPALRFVGGTGTDATAPTSPALQPAQPATGPGGADLAYDGLRAQHYGPQPDGSGAPTGYWLFEPLGPRATNPAKTLPLVLYLHGFDGVDPEVYHVWIDHIVRRGAILIYPDFQTANLPPDAAHFLAIDQSAPTDIQASVTDALAVLTQHGHATPDLTKMAVVGHSIGGLLAADYAATAAAANLPVPSALLLAMPGCAPGCSVANFPLLPATTRVVVLVGNQDTLYGENTAKQIWGLLGAIPAANKAYIRLIGDTHGQPPLVADHFVAETTTVYFGGLIGALDAFDFYGTWKWTDALMDCSFTQTNCQDAFGSTTQEQFMGTWSDGTPVAAAVDVTDPGTPTP